jgi:hypothetical protein
MTDLTLRVEPATRQVIFEGIAAGPAGEAALAPLEGLDLAFDRADGHLVRVIVGAENAPVLALLTRLFGAQVLRALRYTKEPGPAGPITVTSEPVLCAALSSLARLDAARATSPVWASPWWAAEAAVLAEAAGLRARVLTEARARALGQDPLVAPGSAPRIDVAAEIEGLTKDCVRLPGLYWMLDPGLAPPRLFQPGLSPHSDLLVGHDVRNGRLMVEVTIATGADRAEVGKWHARLVDSARRCVVDQANLVGAGPRLRAELNLGFPLTDLSELWVEVVEDAGRPVRSTKAHRIQRALRWADAALRAERAPAGLAPEASAEDWSSLAAVAWERCARDWAAAGDPVRAAAAKRPPVQLYGPVCLAESLGE